VIQLLREWSPGYGGIERVAHSFAAACGGSVFCLRAPSRASDPLPVTYRRCHLPSLTLGRFLLVLPTPALWRMLLSREPMLVHLPCPTVLALAWLARRINPDRLIRVHWHAFLQKRGGLIGLLEGIYRPLALRWATSVRVITTSPVLLEALVQCGVSASSIDLLPCSLPSEVEPLLLRHRARRNQDPEGRLIFIGRLDSYKRVDWLLDAFAATSAARVLEVLGDGPNRTRLEIQAAALQRPDKQVHFHGRVSEERKQELIQTANLMVLPSNRCNEAFGIVQLEAMASGIPSIAFDLPRSGMYWVSALPDLPWTGDPADLSAILEFVLADPGRYRRLCHQACERYDLLFAHRVWRQRLPEVLEDQYG